MEWWVISTGWDSNTPVSTEKLLGAIAAGTIQPDVLVCGVGDDRWTPAHDVFPLAAAAAERSGTAPAPEDDRTVVDFGSAGSDLPKADPLYQFDDPAEQTLVDRAPFHPSTMIDGAQHAVEDPDEGIVVHAKSLSSLEPVKR
jgi:hypothetical protein